MCDSFVGISTLSRCLLSVCQRLCIVFFLIPPFDAVFIIIIVFIIILFIC